MQIPNFTLSVPFGMFLHVEELLKPNNFLWTSQYPSLHFLKTTTNIYYFMGPTRSNQS